jgi:O-antigen ligase
MNERGLSLWPTLLIVVGVAMALVSLFVGQFMVAFVILAIVLVAGLGALFSRRPPDAT